MATRSCCSTPRTAVAGGRSATSAPAPCRSTKRSSASATIHTSWNCARLTIEPRQRIDTQSEGRSLETTVAAINHAQNLANIVVPPTRVIASTRNLFDEQRNSWRTLKDRFVWCAICVWTHLSDTDIEEFKRLKAVRDSIAHGSISVPRNASVAAVERLATK